MKPGEAWPDKVAQPRNRRAEVRQFRICSPDGTTLMLAPLWLEAHKLFKSRFLKHEMTIRRSIPL